MDNQEPSLGLPTTPKKSKKKWIIGGIVGTLLLVVIIFGSTTNFFGALKVYTKTNLEFSTTGISKDYSYLWAQVCAPAPLAVVDGENLMARVDSDLTDAPEIIVGDREATEDTGSVDSSTSRGESSKDTGDDFNMPSLDGGEATSEDTTEESSPDTIETEIVQMDLSGGDDETTNGAEDDDKELLDGGAEEWQTGESVDPTEGKDTDDTTPEEDTTLPDTTMESYVEDLGKVEGPFTGTVDFTIDNVTYSDTVTVESGSCEYAQVDTANYKLLDGNTYTVNLTLKEDTVGTVDTERLEFTMPEDETATDITFGIKMPDLAVSDISLEEGYLTVVTENIGTGDVPANAQENGHTFIYVDDELAWAYIWELLPDTGFFEAGGSGEIQKELSGSHLVQVCVDALDILGETDEENNCVAVLLDDTGNSTETTPDVSIEFNQKIADLIEDGDQDNKPDYNFELNQELIDLIGTPDTIILEIAGIEALDWPETVEEAEPTITLDPTLEIDIPEPEEEDDDGVLEPSGVEELDWTTAEEAEPTVTLDPTLFEDEAVGDDDDDEVLDTGPYGELEYDFPDVETGSWYEDAVYELADLGIMTGNDDGDFEPGKVMNRAEIAKVAVESFGYEIQEDYDAGFSDVNDEWFEDYVNTAAYYGIISGYTDGTFRPAEAVNRAEATKVLVGAVVEHLTDVEYFFGNPDIWDEAIEDGYMPSFDDVTSPDWFYESVMQAVFAGAISGYDDGEFKPANTILRAEAAKIVTILLDIAATPTI